MKGGVVIARGVPGRKSRHEEFAPWKGGEEMEEGKGKSGIVEKEESFGEEGRFRSGSERDACRKRWDSMGGRRGVPECCLSVWEAGH